MGYVAEVVGRVGLAVVGLVAAPLVVIVGLFCLVAGCGLITLWWAADAIAEYLR